MPQAPIWRGGKDPREQPNSPRVTLSATPTATRVYIGGWDEILEFYPAPGSIDFTIPGFGWGWIVASFTVEKMSGHRAKLTVEYAGIATGSPIALPTNEASITTERFERATADHPFFSALTEKQRHALQVLLDTTETEDAGKYKAAKVIVDASPLAGKLYAKLKSGDTHTYNYSAVYRLQVHSYTAPFNLTMGGFREQAPFFPIVPPSGVSWLRESDSVSFNGSYWTVERKWIGAPDGEWDPDLYP